MAYVTLHKTATATVQGVLGLSLLLWILWLTWSHPLSEFDDHDC